MTTKITNSNNKAFSKYFIMGLNGTYFTACYSYCFNKGDTKWIDKQTH